MTDITIINNDVKKMKDNKKPGEPVASSRDVAKRFGKRHDHVIRDIAEIVKSFPKNGDTPLFFKTEYVHPQNHQKYPEPGRLFAAGDGLYRQGGRPVNGRNKRWAEQRWDKRQPERLAHIRKKKEDKSHEKAKKPLPEAGPPHRGRRV